MPTIYSEGYSAIWEMWVQSALRFDRVIAPVIGATRFIGITSIMLAIGLALVTIVVNLRATALLLPTGFSTLITTAQGQLPEEEDLTVYEPMSLAPWNLFFPLAVGAVVAISATLPVVILLAIFIHRRLGELFAGLGGPNIVSDRFETAFWATNLFGASWQPWMLGRHGAHPVRDWSVLLYFRGLRCGAAIDNY